MSVTYRKKLIEVALPLEAINVASAREKSIRHGHPSTLHLWWARRPLAACRAVLFASLVDDPDSDPTFRKADGSVDEDRAGARRAELFNLIEELVQWENSNNESVLNRARAEIAASVASRKILDNKEWKKDQTICNEKAWQFVCRMAKPQNVNAFLAEYAPPVLDPFCGGGSIPLEAQRLGLRAYASDLNPVPVLITKALIEIPPKFANMPPVNPDSRGEAGPAGKKGKGRGKSVLGKSDWRGPQGLAEDVRYYGKWVRDEAEKRIGNLYPKMRVTAEMIKDRPDLKAYVDQDLVVIAWLWARTVASPNPTLGGAHVPLAASLMVSTKPTQKSWAEICIDPEKPDNWRFEIRSGAITPEAEARAKSGTRAGKAKDFMCALSGVPIPRSHIQAEGKADRLGVRLMAVVCEGQRERVYLSPDHHQVKVASSAEHLQAVEESKRTFLSGATPTRAMITGGVCSAYGLRTWGHLFTSRQLAALITFSDLVAEARAKVLADARAAGTLPIDERSIEKLGNGPQAYADSIATYLAFSISKLSDRSSSLCSWFTERDSTRSTFSRQALPMVWDFAELNTLNAGTGTFEGANNWTAEVIDLLPAAGTASVVQLDARQAMAVVTPSPIVSTDPPYYDNIGYADLSDFFYVWLRRSLAAIAPTLCATLLTPKSQELIASSYRHNGSKEAAREYFESGLGEVFERIRKLHPAEIPFTVFYAFKQTETDTPDDDLPESVESNSSTGWETMLSGLVRAGFTISGTWPVRTELANKIGMTANMLASSIVLSCRPRPADAPLTTRREFLNSLKGELPDALKHLQRGSIAPVDLAQAAIGPGMAVFTRYSKVMEADGSPMKVRQALALINQTLDEVLAEQEGEFDADTRWALAWFEQYSMEDGPYGVAETLSKAKNTAVNALEDAGIVHSRAGKVRLLKRDELPSDWNPATDTRLRHWEIVQYLIRALESEGEMAAADLLRKLGGLGEVARDLAYRLYNLCERKKWPQEALAYNSLVIAWPEISKLARSSPKKVETQGEMFDGARA